MVGITKKTTTINKKSNTTIATGSNKMKPVGLTKKNEGPKKPLLSEEIMEIVSGSSNVKKSIDPESVDYFGDNAKITDSYEDFGDIDDDNSGSRLRGDIDSGFTTGKYSGKKGSRKSNDDEDNDFDPDQELSSDEEYKQDLDDVFDFEEKSDNEEDNDDDENIVQSSNIDKADQLFKKLQKQQQPSSIESKEPKLLNITNEADEMEKAINTKNQTVLYNEFLTTRIYLQKAINFANRLPKPKQYKEFYDYDESIKSKFDSVKKSSYQLVSEFYNLQSELIEKNQDIPKPSNKRKIREDQSLTEVWNIIDEQNQRLHEFHTSTITKWNNRISIAGTTTTNKNLKSLNQSILSQITNTLNDIERLQKRTKLKRSTYKIYGDEQKDNNNNEEDEEEKDEYDDEIFDDTDFYQNLLRELENNNDDESNQVGSQYWIEMKNLKKKKKKKVNQKASKGRILRYEVFPKLENFMTPIQIPDPDWNIDQLYQNLFGGIGNTNNN